MLASDQAEGKTPALRDALTDARRSLSVCNACRYCEGFCAVFPAMELRREFSDGDLTYLANLCHNCRGCYYACQYAPPHPFAINLPAQFQELRTQSYMENAWPQALGGLFERNGVIVSLVTAFGIALALCLSVALQDPKVLFSAQDGAGAFYRLVPAWLMIGTALATFGFACLVFLVGAVKFWRNTGASLRWDPKALAQAVGDVLTLRYLGGGGEGCNDTDESFTQKRRWLHHAMFYGFTFCFASTTVASIYEHFLGIVSPFPFWSWPVMLGAIGGVLMVIGCGGLLWVKFIADRAPLQSKRMGADVALLLLLLLTAATGLLLLGLRSTPAMGILLAVHLGIVLALFLVMPYSKFVHGIYRSAALLRHAIEQRHANRPVGE